MRFVALLAFVSALAAGPITASASNTDFEQTMNTFVAKSMQAFDVIPGCAVCVVQGDRVVYLAGFGSRDVERTLPVTGDTGFYIASSTKSFLGMTAAVLAEAGKLDLDAPVSRYLPGLELPAPLSADSITVRAMLTHRTGINNAPVQLQLAYKGSLDRDAFFEMMRTQSKPMPTDFAYSNLGYNMFGYALEEITHQPWQEVVADLVLRPIGMTHTTTSMEQAARGDLALPYTRRGDIWQPEKLKTDSTMHAAGGIVTTASDLARWLIVNLNEGRIDGRQAIPADAIRTAHTKQAETDAEFYRFHRTGYGLGWYLSDFEGEQLTHHFGGFDGYHAHISFMPEQHIGVAVLINTNEYEAGQMAHMVAAFAYETLLGRPGVEEKYTAELASLAARTHGIKQLKEDVAQAMETLEAGNTARGTEQILAALAAARDAGIADERELNNLGYTLLKQERFEPAIAVFRFNVENHSQSANAHDSLGEAYEKAGRLEPARESYAKAWELGRAAGDRSVEAYKRNLDRVSAAR